MSLETPQATGLVKSVFVCVNLLLLWCSGWIPVWVSWSLSRTNSCSYVRADIRKVLQISNVLCNSVTEDWCSFGSKGCCSRWTGDVGVVRFNKGGEGGAIAVQQGISATQGYGFDSSGSGDCS